MISSTALDPVEDGDPVKGKGIPYIRCLIVSQRLTQSAKAMCNRVFPYLIITAIDCFVHLQVRFLNLSKGARLEAYIEMAGEVPGEAELSVPVEVVTEGEVG